MEDIGEGDVFQQNAFFLRNFQRVELLDRKTCLVCAKMDGETYTDPLGKLHPNCFPTGIMITTINGKKDISKIQIGDITYTHEGNWKPVVRLFKNHYKGNLIKIWFDDERYLLATPNHGIRVISEGIESWKKISDIVVGDKVVAKLE